MENSRIAEVATQIFSEYLKENKCRRTPERFAVLDAIYSMNGSFEIKELMDHLEEEKKFRVSRATIYNTITKNIKKFHLTHYSLHLHGLCNKCHQAMKRRKARLTKSKLQ